MKKIIGISLIVVVAFLIPSAAYAGGLMDSQVVMGGSFTLQAGETLEGDLLVFGGSATLEEGSTVDGDVFVLGGSASIAGQVTGDLAVFGGSVNLRSSGIIEGDVASFGGNVNRAEGSIIGGGIVSDGGFVFPFGPELPAVPGAPEVPRIPGLPGSQGFGPFEIFRIGIAPVLSIFWFFFRTLLISGLAMLLVLIWQEPTTRVSDAIAGYPFLAGGIGLLTVLVLPLLLFLLVLTICLIPVAFLTVVVLVVAFIYGWIAVGFEVGKRLVEAFKWTMNPVLAAGIGTLLISLVFGGIGLIPCIGWIFPFILAVVGFGGVILTVFGTRDYGTTGTELGVSEVEAS
jgi:hypothetical protein